MCNKIIATLKREAHKISSCQLQCTEAGGDIEEWNRQLNTIPRDRPCGVMEHVSRGVPLRDHIPLRGAFNHVLAHICSVANNIQAAKTLHLEYNQEDNETQTGGSEDEEIDSGNEPFDSDV